METTNARSAQSSRSTSNSSSDQASNSSAGWERFLPPRPLRVLLVEEDIATRQIVCALLSKCGYEGKPIFPFPSLYFSLFLSAEL